MNQTKIINNFNKAVKRVSKKFKNPLDMFALLTSYCYSRLELMIIDSSYKNMPLETLYNTLLLPKDSYIKMLQNLTSKLNSI